MGCWRKPPRLGLKWCVSRVRPLVPSIRDPQRLREERPGVRLLGDKHRGRLAETVSRLRVDADEDRCIAALRRLHRRREFERVSRDDAVVMVGGKDERRWVMRARLEVVQR